MKKADRAELAEKLLLVIDEYVLRMTPVEILGILESLKFYMVQHKRNEITYSDASEGMFQ